MDTSKIPRVTAEEVAGCIERLRKAGIDPQKVRRGKIAEVCGIGVRRARTIREWIKQRPQTRAEQVCSSKPSETREQTDNSLSVCLNQTRIRSADELIKHCGIDTNEWALEKFRCSVWEMGAVPRATGNDKVGWQRKSTKIMVQRLYSVAAWFRRKTVEVAVRSVVDELIARAKKYAPKYKPIKRPPKQSGNMLEVMMPDIHFGRLAWGKETGWEDYDLEIGEGDFRKAIEEIVSRTSFYHFDKILLVVGNDLINMDNRENTTTHGTAQASDSRYQKVFLKVHELQVWAIERLREVAPVEVLLVPGNHDTLTVFHVGHALECWFKNCKDVHVDNAPTLRKYFEWGVNGILFLHGDKGKLKDYALLMATECREMWGRTTWHEVHTGDKHHVHLEEQLGARVRILPSLAPSSHWESEHNYVGAQRSAEAYVWNKNEGLICSVTYTIPRQPQGIKPAA